MENAQVVFPARVRKSSEQSGGGRGSRQVPHDGLKTPRVRARHDLGEGSERSSCGIRVVLEESEETDQGEPAPRNVAIPFVGETPEPPTESNQESVAEYNPRP